MTELVDCLHFMQIFRQNLVSLSNSATTYSPDLAPRSFTISPLKGKL